MTLRDDVVNRVRRTELISQSLVVHKVFAAIREQVQLKPYHDFDDRSFRFLRQHRNELLEQHSGGLWG